VAAVTVGRAIRIAGVLAAALFVAYSASAGVRGEPACRTPEIRQHGEAVFGHFSTRAAAAKLLRRVRAKNFRGGKIENDGCGDFEVELDGADTQAVRTSFAKEAAAAGFQVTFEQTAPPAQYRAGEVVGVYGQFSKLAEANALAAKIAAAGFRYADIARVDGQWWLVWPQVPNKASRSISREVKGAGFDIKFRPGVFG
jgi:hypothetical protein